jgi:alpha-galactosidase
VNVDPDVVFFRSKYNALVPHEKKLLQDLGTIAGFKATSDLPQWLSRLEKEMLREFLESAPLVEIKSRYAYQIDGRVADFRRVVPMHLPNQNIPVWLAKYLGLLKIATCQALPAIWESRAIYRWSRK